MLTVPRHKFVPAELRDRSYENLPLPIGAGQTISQPFIVALMSERAQLGPGGRVLEIGTGCGYQTAVLAELANQVFTIEVVPELAHRAWRTLQRLGYGDVHARIGDGYAGWPEAAPFDAIVVTAAPSRVPPPLVDQLTVGGRLVIPVGDDQQDLLVITRTPGSFHEERVVPVRFVPMTGRAQEPS